MPCELLVTVREMIRRREEQRLEREALVPSTRLYSGESLCPPGRSADPSPALGSLDTAPPIWGDGLELCRPTRGLEGSGAAAMSISAVPSAIMPSAIASKGRSRSPVAVPDLPIRVSSPTTRPSVANVGLTATCQKECVLLTGFRDGNVVLSAMVQTSVDEGGSGGLGASLQPESLGGEHEAGSAPRDCGDGPSRIRPPPPSSSSLRWVSKSFTVESLLIATMKDNASEGVAPPPAGPAKNRRQSTVNPATAPRGGGSSQGASFPNHYDVLSGGPLMFTDYGCASTDAAGGVTAVDAVVLSGSTPSRLSVAIAVAYGTCVVVSMESMTGAVTGAAGAGWPQTPSTTPLQSPQSVSTAASAHSTSRIRVSTVYLAELLQRLRSEESKGGLPGRPLSSSGTREAMPAPTGTFSGKTANSVRHSSPATGANGSPVGHPGLSTEPFFVENVTLSSDARFLALSLVTLAKRYVVVLRLPLLSPRDGAGAAALADPKRGTPNIEESEIKLNCAAVPPERLWGWCTYVERARTVNTIHGKTIEELSQLEPKLSTSLLDHRPEASAGSKLLLNPMNAAVSPTDASNNAGASSSSIMAEPFKETPLPVYSSCVFLVDDIGNPLQLLVAWINSSQYQRLPLRPSPQTFSTRVEAIQHPPAVEAHRTPPPPTVNDFNFTPPARDAKSAGVARRTAVSPDGSFAGKAKQWKPEVPPPSVEVVLGSTHHCEIPGVIQTIAASPDRRIASFGCSNGAVHVCSDRRMLAFASAVDASSLHLDGGGLPAEWRGLHTRVSVVHLSVFTDRSFDVSSEEAGGEGLRGVRRTRYAHVIAGIAITAAGQPKAVYGAASLYIPLYGDGREGSSLVQSSPLRSRPLGLFDQASTVTTSVSTLGSTVSEDAPCPTSFYLMGLPSPLCGALPVGPLPWCLLFLDPPSNSTAPRVILGGSAGEDIRGGSLSGFDGTNSFMEWSSTAERSPVCLAWDTAHNLLLGTLPFALHADCHRSPHLRYPKREVSSPLARADRRSSATRLGSLARAAEGSRRENFSLPSPTTVAGGEESGSVEVRVRAQQNNANNSSCGLTWCGWQPVGGHAAAGEAGGIVWLHHDEDSQMQISLKPARVPSALSAAAAAACGGWADTGPLGGSDGTQRPPVRGTAQSSPELSLCHSLNVSTINRFSTILGALPPAGGGGHRTLAPQSIRPAFWSLTAVVDMFAPGLRARLPSSLTLAQLADFLRRVPPAARSDPLVVSGGWQLAAAGRVGGEALEHGSFTTTPSSPQHRLPLVQGPQMARPSGAGGRAASTGSGRSDSLNSTLPSIAHKSNEGRESAANETSLSRVNSRLSESRARSTERNDFTGAPPLAAVADRNVSPHLPVSIEEYHVDSFPTKWLTQASFTADVCRTRLNGMLGGWGG